MRNTSCWIKTKEACFELSQPIPTLPDPRIGRAMAYCRRPMEDSRRMGDRRGGSHPYRHSDSGPVMRFTASGFWALVAYALLPVTWLAILPLAFAVVCVFKVPGLEGR